MSFLKSLKETDGLERSFELADERIFLFMNQV